MKQLARSASPAGRTGHQRPALRTTAVAAGCLVAIGLAGIRSMGQFGGVGFSVPSCTWCTHGQ
jgi:hypothetical protein